MLSYLQQATMYEVNTRQYSSRGDFNSFRNHLPRLKAMGVDILWFMPVHPIGMKNRKGILGSYYSSRNYLDINPEFGTKADFKKLVSKAHELGMKVIIDWVANHAAWDHEWTLSNPDFFEADKSGQFISPHDWSDVIQIDHQNNAAHEAMCEAMLYWIQEFDIDGFRADLAHLTPLHFWKNTRKKAEKIKPGLIWLAETEDPDYYQAFDIIYAWQWMHKSAELIRNSISVHEIIEVLQQQKNNSLPASLQLYFSANHDENSWNGTEYEKYGIYAKAFAVFSFTYPGSVPLIYSGQEIPNYKRLAFFDKDELYWEDGIQLERFYRVLATHRKNTFQGGAIEWIVPEKKILTFRRTNGKQEVLVCLNLDTEKLPFPFPSMINPGKYLDIFSGNKVHIHNDLIVELEPGEFLVLERQE